MSIVRLRFDLSYYDLRLMMVFLCHAYRFYPSYVDDLLCVSQGRCTDALNVASTLLSKAAGSSSCSVA